MRLACPKCAYSWEYRGSSLYPCCPRCLRKFRLPPQTQTRLRILKDLMIRMSEAEGRDLDAALHNLGATGYPKDLEDLISRFRVMLRKYSTRDEARLLGLWEVCAYCGFTWMPVHPQALRCPKCRRIQP